MRITANQHTSTPVRHRLAFTGAPGRVGRLTWAQQSMLEIVHDLSPYPESLNLHFALPLRPGVCERDVLDTVLDLVTTHEALRTVYVPSPEGPGQRALDAGELAVDVIEAGTDPDASVAEDASRTLASRPFDIAADLPVRVALLTRDGRPWQLAFAASHLVTDFGGIGWLRYHLRALLSDPPATEPTAALVRQPLDEQEWEHSPAGVRAAGRALRYHETTLRAMPQTMLPRTAHDAGPPRFRYLRFDSPALAMAVPALAARHNVHPTAVLHAGICSVVGYVSGLDRGVLQLTMSNRNVPRQQPAVGILTQHPPSWVDLRDAGLAEVIARCGSAVVGALRFARYPGDELTSLRRRVELDRGMALDLSCWLNDRRLPTVPDGDEAPGARLLAEATTRSRTAWIGADKASSSSYFVHADDAGDALRLTMLVDTTLVPPYEAVAWLHAVERLLCAGVTTDVGTAGIGEHVGLAPASYGEDWRLVDASRIHLPSTADLVRHAAAGRCADVFGVETAHGTRLVAFLDGTGTPVDLDRLHRDCVAALPGRRTAMAPHRYVLCAGAPHGTGLDAWRALPVLAEGTGRPDPCVPEDGRPD